MSAFESSYKSQLQGVSQQVARERLDGQVSVQENMLSDPVSNVRRRPGAQWVYSSFTGNGNINSMRAWETEVGGERVQIILNTEVGRLWVLDSNYTQKAVLNSTYLMTSKPQDIQTAVVGQEFFIANLGVTPTAGPQPPITAPTRQGFAYVRAGAFSKTYDLRIETSIGSLTTSYTTPDGSHVGDAALATPEYIMTKLVGQVNGMPGLGVTASVDMAYSYFLAGDGVTLSIGTGAGSGYMVTSGKAYVPQESDLPSRLPFIANGFIMSCGPKTALRYYKYVGTDLSWVETAAYQSALGYIAGCPVSVYLSNGAWLVSDHNFEGRLAGDDVTNPYPDFFGNGKSITGIGSYQGRLVILAGNMVNMSASNNPRRFFRSTVTTLLDSDTISVGSSGATSASWRYAVAFSKDLLLFSDSYQALIPGGSTAITPRNASVLVTSAYTADTTSCPVITGQSLMFSIPRSKYFFGAMEMLPSQSSNNQYDSTDVTLHLPKYLAGRCRNIVSNSGASMALMLPSTDRNSIIVHEYQWQGQQKVQQAWHKWTFAYPVAWAYFANQLVHVMFINAQGYMVLCTIDPRAGSSTTSGDKLPFLDFCSFRNVAGNLVDWNSWMQDFDITAINRVKLAVASGPLAGEPVGATPEGQVLRTVRSYPNGRVAYGLPYTSVLSPTAPMRKDYQGVVISSDKLTILRFMVSTNNSAEYRIAVADASMVDSAYAAPTLYYSSKELNLGAARTGADSTSIVPARTSANTTSLVMSTGGVGEMNIVGIEYVARSHDKIRRK